MIVATEIVVSPSTCVNNDSSNLIILSKLILIQVAASPCDKPKLSSVF